MKRLYGIFLLLILAFNIAGVYLIFSVQQSQIKSQVAGRISQGLPGKDMQVLSFSPAELQQISWTEEGKEFRYKGRMYDVVRVQHQGEKVQFYCYSDTDETELFAWLGDMLQKESTEGPADAGNTMAKLVKMVSSLIYLPPGNISVLDKKDFNTSHFQAFMALHASPYIEAINPPPQSV